MIRAGLFILFIFFSGILLVGQDTQIDSLKSVIAELPNDSTRVNTILELATYYYRSDKEEAIRLGNQAKELAEEINYQKGLGYAHKTIGIGYYYMNNDLEALLSWEEALVTFQNINFRKGTANILSNLGAVYFNKGDDEKAIKYYLQSLKEAEEVNDSLRIATVLVNIGAVYSNKDDSREMALEYYLRCLPYAEALGDYELMGTVTVNLGELYLLQYIDGRDTSLLTSSLKYLELALDVYKKSASGNVPYAVNAIGKVYAAREDYTTAFNYHTQAYELAEANDSQIEMMQALSEMAKTKFKEGDYAMAIKYFHQALPLTETDTTTDLKDIYEGLARTYAIIGDYNTAYVYLGKLDTVKTEMYNAKMDEQIQTESLKYDITQRQKTIDIQHLSIERQKTLRNASLIVGALILLLALGLLNRYTYTRKTNRIIAHEKERSDKLLLNILPEETAEELKNKGSATPKHYKKVSVLFTDFKGFTKIAEKLTPDELVEELNTCFLEFDRIIDKHNLEKIKTIGDAYMCAGGIPVANETNPIDIVYAGLEIKDYMESLKKEREARGEDFWELRIGIHTGPVIAGVVGKNKFAYDIWGDAVNTASRMESSGIPGKVNISGNTFDLIKDQFECTHRGKIQAKNKGEIDMYIVESTKTAVPDHD